MRKFSRGNRWWIIKVRLLKHGPSRERLGPIQQSFFHPPKHILILSAQFFPNPTIRLHDLGMVTIGLNPNELGSLNSMFNLNKLNSN